MPANAYGQEIGAPVPGWTPRPLSPRAPPLEGRFCRLEPLAPDHADALFSAFAAADDGRDWTYMTVERFDDPVAWRQFVATEAASRDPLHYAILVDGTPLAKAALMWIDPANGVIEIGAIAFSPRLKRTPAATEAIFLLIRRVFDELGYRRLEWKCDRLNGPSCRAAERYGFVFEGIFRQAVVTKGRNRDTAWFAMLDRDWPAARAAFEAWLAPGNFDADGQQRRSLASFRQTSAE